MATQKKTLLELMVEAGVEWPDVAEYSAQDKDDLLVYFYASKPWRPTGWPNWHHDGVTDDSGKQLPELCRNWYQTIVTREQYEAAVAKKVKDGDKVVDWSLAPEWADRVIEGNLTNRKYWANEKKRMLMVNGRLFSDDLHMQRKWKIIEHRPVDTESAITEPQFCESVTRSIPTNTIEQRITELHVMEKQVAEFRAKLTDDLHALGITWLDGAIVADEPKPEQPVITDWRDLLVGDVVEYVRGTIGSCKGKQGRVCEIDDGDDHNRIHVMFDDGSCYWCSEWRFIRRP